MKQNCTQCGRLFTPVQHQQRHCTPRCRQAYARARQRIKLGERACEMCGKVFTSEAPSVQTCSTLCGAALRQSKRRAKETAEAQAARPGAPLPWRAIPGPSRYFYGRPA